MKPHCLTLSSLLIIGLAMLFSSSANAQEIHSFVDEKVPNDWIIDSGEWEVIDGKLTVDASDEMATIFFGDPDQQNYEISAKITFESVENAFSWASIIFRAGSEGEPPWSHVALRCNTETPSRIEFAVFKADETWSVRESSKVPAPPKLDQTKTPRKSEKVQTSCKCRRARTLFKRGRIRNWFRCRGTRTWFKCHRTQISHEREKAQAPPEPNQPQVVCKLGKPQTLRVVVQGTTVETYLDEKRLIRSAFCIDRDQGCLGLAASGCEVTFDDVTIKSLPPSKMKFSEMKRQPCITVAHRGYSGIAPENTLSSAREAIRAGATGSEFDIRATQDGHVVLMHDTTVDRTTNGKGEIVKLPFAEVRKLDAGSWKDKKFTGEKVPTLDEMLAVFKNSGCTPVIEIKVKGISQKVVDAVRRADMLDEAVVIAFNGDVVREIRELEPKLPCYWLWSKGLNGTPEKRAATIINEAAKHKTNMVDLHYDMLSAEVIAELKRQGIKVWCWTVDDPMVMDALMRWGVEGITTNYPNKTIDLNKEIKN